MQPLLEDLPNTAKTYGRGLLHDSWPQAARSPGTTRRAHTRVPPGSLSAVSCAEEHEFYESVEAGVAELLIATGHASPAPVAWAERAAGDARARWHDARMGLD